MSRQVHTGSTRTARYGTGDRELDHKINWWESEAVKCEVNCSDEDHVGRFVSLTDSKALGYVNVSALSEIECDRGTRSLKSSKTDEKATRLRGQ